MVQAYKTMMIRLARLDSFWYWTVLGHWKKKKTVWKRAQKQCLCEGVYGFAFQPQACSIVTFVIFCCHFSLYHIHKRNGKKRSILVHFQSMCNIISIDHPPILFVSIVNWLFVRGGGVDTFGCGQSDSIFIYIHILYANLYTNWFVRSHILFFQSVFLLKLDRIEYIVCICVCLCVLRGR